MINFDANSTEHHFIVTDKSALGQALSRRLYRNKPYLNKCDFYEYINPLLQTENR